MRLDPGYWSSCLFVTDKFHARVGHTSCSAEHLPENVDEVEDLNSAMMEQFNSKLVCLRKSCGSANYDTYILMLETFIALEMRMKVSEMRAAHQIPMVERKRDREGNAIPQ